MAAIPKQKNKANSLFLSAIETTFLFPVVFRRLPNKINLEKFS